MQIDLFCILVASKRIPKILNTKNLFSFMRVELFWDKIAGARRIRNTSIIVCFARPLNSFVVWLLRTDIIHLFDSKGLMASDSSNGNLLHYRR
jgi:hypothetical protein